MLTFYRFFILIAFVLTVANAQAADYPTDMLIEPPQGWVTKRASVPFSHALHESKAVNCKACHHTWNGEGSPTGCAVEGCHNQESRKTALSFYGAFHDRKNERSCMGCHLKVRKESDAKPPRSCKGCHVKQ